MNTFKLIPTRVKINLHGIEIAKDVLWAGQLPELGIYFVALGPKESGYVLNSQERRSGHRIESLVFLYGKKMDALDKTATVEDIVFNESGECTFSVGLYEHPISFHLNADISAETKGREIKCRLFEVETS